MMRRSDKEVEAFVEKLSDIYRSQQISRGKLSCVWPIRNKEEIFGMATFYLGAAPIIAFSNNQNLWTPLAISLCIFCLIIGAGQISLRKIL